VKNSLGREIPTPPGTGGMGPMTSFSPQTLKLSPALGLTSVLRLPLASNAQSAPAMSPMQSMAADTLAGMSPLLDSSLSPFPSMPSLATSASHRLNFPAPLHNRPIRKSNSMWSLKDLKSRTQKRTLEDSDSSRGAKRPKPEHPSLKRPPPSLLQFMQESPTKVESPRGRASFSGLGESQNLC
jgi:hypothetical protein